MRLQFPAAFAALALLVLPSSAKAERANAQPPAFVKGIFDSMPPNILHLAAVGNGNRVVLFYDEGSLLEAVPNSEDRPNRKSFVQAWNGASWDEPREFSPVSEALNVGGEIWALANGGYRVSKDGEAWSPLNPRPDWKEPFGCVLAGRPHVFYVDDGVLRETEFDGSSWKAPRVIPGNWSSRVAGFPFGSRMQAAVVSGRIHLFRLYTDRRQTQLLDYDDAGTGAPQVVGSAQGFRLLDAPDGLHLFYRDMLSGERGAPSVSGAFAMMSEMQSRSIRTYHRVFNGSSWSEPEAIVTGQSMALDAARTDDGLWLLASEGMNISQTIRRDGVWSQLKAVPGTMAMTRSRMYPFALKMFGIWLIFAVPLMLVFGLFVWGVSAAIESSGPVELDLAGNRLRCASLLRRAGAQLADALVLWIAPMLIMLPLSLGGLLDPSAIQTRLADHFFLIWSTMMLSMMTLYFGYFAICEARWGRTPGKRLLGIRVIADDGTACSWRAALIRNVIRVVDAMPYYLVGAAAFGFGKKHQRVGDMAARTLVVLDRPA